MDGVLLPVFLLIGAGFVAGRIGLIAHSSTKALSDVAFYLLVPALLFRSMARTDFHALDLSAPAAYFSATVPVFIGVVAALRWRGRAMAEAGVAALACAYSNLVMLGLPLVRLAYGDAGFAVLLTIVSVHSLILLTMATMVVELGAPAADASDPGRRGRILSAAKTSLLHPVILPIFAGIAWSLTGWRLPAPIDATLALAGGAGPTMCLLLLGASLSQFDPKRELRGALALTGVKNLLHPLLAWALGRWVFGLDPLTLAVVVIASSLPIGANVYLFAQRYGVAMPQVSAGVTISTLATGLAIGPLLGWFPG